ncbi:MAG: Rid family hydrolase [Paludibacter sp.]
MQFVNYRSFSATHTGFSKTVIQLLEKVPEKEQVLTINIFGLVTGNDYLSNLQIIRQTALHVFGRIPLLNYVAQSPENENTLIAEVGYLPDSISNTAVKYHDLPQGRYLSVDSTEFNALLIEGLMSDNIQQSIAEQSSEVFDKVQQILQASSMTAENIVRQWNYIGHITGVENNNQNYQEFNNKRANFYSNSAWGNGYPAATGISMDIHAVNVSLIALKYHDSTRIFPVNNSQQFAAHCYSKTVLGNSKKKETPKFERAKLIVSGKSACCFISGTAAILGEKSLANDNVFKQTSQTIALIRHLISPENLKVNGIDFSGDLKIVHLRVYVKETADFEVVRSVLELELPGINAFYVCAGVCRDELLVEIEGIAITES